MTNGLTKYVAVTLTNSQSVPTTNVFQQYLTINNATYSGILSGDLGNIRFFDDAELTRPLFSWCESGNSLMSPTSGFWVRLTRPIPANSSTKIYMGFLAVLPGGSGSFQTTYDGVIAGIFPFSNSQRGYGVQDNGASVFASYENFKASTLPPAWSPITTPTISTIGPSNPITGSFGGMTFNAPIASWDGFYTPSFTVPAPGVVESYFTVGAGGYGAVAIKGGYGFENRLGDVTPEWGMARPSPSFAGASSPYSTTPYAPFADSFNLVGGYNVNDPTMFIDRTLSQTWADAHVVSGPLALVTYGTSNMNVAYVRSRAYPPNGVMPTASFGKTLSASRPHLPDLDIQEGGARHFYIQPPT